MQQHTSRQDISSESTQSCPDGKYWVRPHKRRKVSKKGQVYIENVKGYCCCYHGSYQTIAEEEQLSFDHLFFVLTLYGEARGENASSRRAIAWVIRNRFTKKIFGDSYRGIVLKPLQFSCWRKNDPNYKVLQDPGKNGTSEYEKQSDQQAWQRCKETFREVFNAPESENPIPQVCHYFNGPPQHRWQEKYFNLPDVPHFHFVKLDK